MRYLYILTLIYLINPTQVQASHTAGAEIWYEFTGDNSSPYDYRVWLQFYRDITVPVTPATLELCVKSSCFTDFSVNFTSAPFTLQPGSDTTYGTSPGSILTPDLDECVDKNSSGDFRQTEIHRYYADITLNGSCNDWSFAFKDNRRNNDNLMTGGYYIEASLDNTTGPNSSPVFETVAIKSFCAGVKAEWSHSATDADNDSLYYELVAAQGSGFSCSTNPSQLSYGPGYSANQPIRTSNGISMDSTKGVMKFTPANPQLVYVKVQVSEYRTDTTAGIIMIGQTQRDIQIAIMGGCSPAANSLNLNGTGDPGDTSVTGSVMAELACGDSIVELSTSSRIQCSSIAADGSDFALFNSQGTLVPIIAAGSDSCRAGYTRSLWLQLHNSIYYNDSLQLVTRQGVDGNTLKNVCGFEINENDSVPFIVESCNTSIAKKEHDFTAMEVYPNPSSNILNITFPNASSQRKLEISDLQGKLLMSVKAGFINNKIDISTLSPGFYILRTVNQNSFNAFRFQKL